MNNYSNIPPSKKSLMNNIINLMIIACVDGKVSEEEQSLINQIAQSYGLSEEEFAQCGQKCNECLQSNQFPIEVPESDDAKVGFIRNLVATMMIDGNISDEERQLIEAIAERFGFKAKEVVDYLIQSINEEIQKPEEIQEPGETTSIAERIQQGKAALLRNDVATAFDHLMEAALADKEGFILLLELLSVEKRLYQLTLQQVEKMKALAEKGYVAAQYALGRYHQVRRPEKDSVDTALTLFNNAAKAGLPDAMAARALMMIRGLLGEIDQEAYYDELKAAFDKGSHLAGYHLYKAAVVGKDGFNADPQGVVDNIKEWLGDKESEDISEISPVYYEILALAYSALNEIDKATEYYSKCVRMGRTDLYSDYVIATCYDDDFEPIDENQLLKALENGIEMGDPYCYVLRADLYEKRFDEITDEKEQETLSAKIAQDLKTAAEMGEGGALVEYGFHSYLGDYGFEENNETAWNCFVKATEMNMAKAWTMIDEMIEEDVMPCERPSSEFLNFSRLMSVRLGDDELLPVLIYNYYKGTMRQFQDEIKKYYLPRYEALSDEVKTDFFGTRFIAIIKADGTADLVEFDLETEDFEELPKFIDADSLNALRTEQLTNLGKEMDLDGRLTAWVDGNRKIQGNMILTLEDEQGQPMSFDDLAELKAIVTSLGATVGGVFYDEFPDDDSRYDSQV